MKSRLAIAGGMMAVTLAGCATAPSSTPQAHSNRPPAAALDKDSTCLTATGSRIPANRPSDCSAIGRSYSSEDIDRTGSTTAAGALRLLDPSITIGH